MLNRLQVPGLSLGLAACCAAPSETGIIGHALDASGPHAEYRVRLLDPVERAAAVELRLTGLDSAQPELSLSLPEGYSFQRLEEPLLAVPLAAHAAAGEALAIAHPEPYRWTVAKGAATDVLVTWIGALTAHDRPDVAARDSFGHPYVAADHALLMTGAHEFHHLWAVSRLDFGDALRFVGEGFTDWYAHVVPARLGITTWKRFGEELGEAVDTWTALAPRLAGSLSQAGGPRFFEGGDAYDATYRGGLLVAAVLDLELRRAGRADGLDGWLRAFVNDARWSPRAPGTTVDDFLEHVESALGAAGRERVARWITGEHGFDPLAELARLDVPFDQRTEPRSVRANFDGLRVVALDPQSEAAQLGLREGDQVRRVNGEEVADERAVQSAWARPADGTSTLTIERDGQTLELSAPAAGPRVRTSVDPAPWQGTEGTFRPSH